MEPFPALLSDTNGITSKRDLWLDLSIHYSMISYDYSRVYWFSHLVQSDNFVYEILILHSVRLDNAVTLRMWLI